MRQRGDPSRLVDAAEDVLRWNARARHEGRPSAREPLLERLAGVGDVARGDERARNPRAADRLGGIVDARLQNEVGIELDVERREPLDHLPHAIDSPLPLRSEKRQQRRRMAIDEITEHVDVAAVADRGDFDAVHELDPGRGRRRFRRLASRDGIVIRDGEHADARGCRPRDELGRRTSSVRRGGVGMEIDHRLRPRLCRSRSSRYSRINRSRCVRSSSANSRKICFPSESSNRSPYRLKNWCEPRSQRMPMSSAC